MTRQEIESRLEVFHFKIIHDIVKNENIKDSDYVVFDELKAFIFQTVIPEVMREILYGEKDGDWSQFACMNTTKRKAKELYNIDL